MHTNNTPREDGDSLRQWQQKYGEWLLRLRARGSFVEIDRLRSTGERQHCIAQVMAVDPAKGLARLKFLSVDYAQSARDPDQRGIAGGIRVFNFHVLADAQTREVVPQLNARGLPESFAEVRTRLGGRDVIPGQVRRGTREEIQSVLLPIPKQSKRKIA